jgi:hypothetical protein
LFSPKKTHTTNHKITFRIGSKFIELISGDLKVQGLGE